MSVFSKSRVKVAAANRGKFDLSSKVMTTLNIGDTQPIYCREVVPGDKWNLSISSFSRLAPLPVPTFAQVKQINRVFYVKYKDIWKGWEDFYTQTNSYYNFSSVTNPKVPWESNNNFVSTLLEVQIQVNSYNSQKVSVPLFDPQEVESNKSFTFNGKIYTITYYGKKVLSLLNGLGIRLNFASTDTTPISLLPILAFLKVHLDYYLPSRYYNTSSIRSLLSNYVAQDFDTEIGSIIQELYNASMYYIDNDYFTASWASPNNIGNNTSIGKNTIRDYSLTGNASNYPVIITDQYSSMDNALSAPRNAGNSTNSSSLSAQGLKILEKLYDWATRKNLSGNKYFEQILTQYGINIPSHDDGRSYYLGGSQAITKFGEVYSTADSNGINVGDYAGRGQMSSRSNSINLDAQDFGVVLCLTSLVPEMGYVQGRNREWLHVSPLDFYQPEFDCVGMQGIRKDELLTVTKEADYKTVTIGTDTYSNKADTIIGYQPRYSEYRRPIDILNGDFAFNTPQDSLAAYHTFRIMPTDKPQLSTLSQYFRRSDSFSDSLNRIFNYQGHDADHFICVYDVSASAKRKMKSAADRFDLEGVQEVTSNSDNSLS